MEAEKGRGIQDRGELDEKGALASTMVPWLANHVNIA